MKEERSKRKKMKHVLFVSCFLFFISYFSLLTSPLSFATTITADNLEHVPEEAKYVATGNVRIEKDGAVLLADHAVLYENTSDAEATGNVVFEDADTFINTERAEMNLDTKTGKLCNALIFFKKGDYWVDGTSVEKVKENHYYASSASFTTCDYEESERPDWCFKGDKVDIVVGRKVTARNVTYRIKGLPILYSPALWAPITSERQTGFLFPYIGSSSTKGFQFSTSFFWAIDENKDATVYLDYYSKRGIGKGVEYRYLDFTKRGEWSAYHLRDREADNLEREGYRLKKDIFEFKGLHEQQIGDARAFVDLNYVNEEDFYKEFAYRRDVRIQRFLQSSAEVSVPLRNARLYLLGQHWIDLQDKGANVPQRLPELGYVVHPSSVGPLLFSLNSSIANFWRDKEPRGQRIDIAPTLSYGFGDRVQVFQSLTLRETAYQLSNSAPFESSPHRETFEYRANALTRLSRHYSSATHIIEPSVSFTFIPETHPLPVFDSTELGDKTASLGFSLYNNVAFRRFSLASTLAQSLNFNAGDRPLSPTTLAVTLSGPFTVTSDLAYDFNKGKMETVNADISLPVFKGTYLRLGERYSRASELFQLTGGITSALSKRWALDTTLWYDLKGGGLRDSTLIIKYLEQCWAVNLTLTRRPGDAIRPPEYSFLILVELKGLGRPLKLYEYSSQSQQSS